MHLVLVGSLFLYLVSATATATLCLSCAPMPSTVPCDTNKTCPGGQECYAKYMLKPDGTVMYEFGCHDSQTCPGQIGVLNGIGKRATGDRELCYKCCHGDMCNQGTPCTGPSTSVKPILVPTTFSTTTSPVNPCSPSPCVRGSCFTSSGNQAAGTFFCQCPAGFIGMHCETVISTTTANTTPIQTTATVSTSPANPCSPIPCVRGTCYFESGNNSGFICLCPSDFTGLHCETVTTTATSTLIQTTGTTKTVIATTSSATLHLTPTTTIFQTTPGPTSENCKRDVVFVFDQSAALGDANFRLSIKYAIEILSQINIGYDMIVTAAVNAQNAFVQTVWNLNTHHDLTNMTSLLSGMTYNGGLSHLESGLWSAYNNILTSGNGDRSYADDVVILFIDGNSYNQAGALSWDAMVKNIAKHVFVVAMDIAQGNNLQELTQLASDSRHVIQPFGATSIVHDVPRIINLMCQ